ncbi:MAG: hypothetical protein NT154_12130, partial [Verrucomicrobia bacterium]|nr:hypothetical protein [Verrucomicrobiota bacterium]
LDSGTTAGAALLGPAGQSTSAALLGPDAKPLPTGSAGQVDLNAVTIRINPPLTNIRLADVLDAIVKVADQPIKYSIEDYAIVFSARDPKAIPLYVRSFKVDPNTLVRNLAAEKAPGEKDSTRALEKDPTHTDSARIITRALVNFFRRVGVDLDPKPNPNAGKSIFFNDRQGMLLVRATLQDLDIIEVALQILNSVPPQINLKCTVVEVPYDDDTKSGWSWDVDKMVPVGLEAGSAHSSNTVPPFTLVGILKDPQLRMVIKTLKQRNGAEFLGEPELTTSSGRQVECKTTHVRSIFKGINKQALTPPGITSTNDNESSVYGAEPMEFGVTLDLVPTVMEDGYTINLPVVTTVLGFLGYDDNRTNRVAVYINGKQQSAVPPLPRVRKEQMASTVSVGDGQTLVLGSVVSERSETVPVIGTVPGLGPLFRSDSTNAQKRNLLIFVTPTIIDPAGNRVHVDDEMPFAREKVPEQPPR